MVEQISITRIKKVIPNGDCALMIQFEASVNNLKTIHALACDFLSAPLPHLCNVIPASESLVLVFIKPINHHINWSAEIQNRIDHLPMDNQDSCVHEVPVCYDSCYASDLIQVCEQFGITRNELIQIHTQNLYEVTNLGFLPGFAYLSGNDVRIDIPRKMSPSISVAAGSVAIANGQTGLYALSSPGGWHVIGRTPLPLLNWNDSPANLMKPLDQVRFIAIDKKTYQRMSQIHEH